jgi:hypothetical protein
MHGANADVPGSWCRATDARARRVIDGRLAHPGHAALWSTANRIEVEHARGQTIHRVQETVSHRAPGRTLVAGFRDRLVYAAGPMRGHWPTRHLNMASDLRSPNGVRTRVSTLRAWSGPSL